MNDFLKSLNVLALLFGMLFSMATASAQPKEIKLPGKAEDIVAGGGGKYLIVRFDELKKVGVFNVAQNKFTGFIPADFEEIRIAAGLEKLLLVDVAKREISRWDIESQEKEQTMKIVVEDLDGLYIPALLMGASTHGPAYFSDKPNVYELNVQTMEMKPIQFLEQAELEVHFTTNSRISSNGATISLPWSVEFQTLIRVGDQWASPLQKIRAGEASLSANGKTLLTENLGHLDRRLNKVTEYDRKTIATSFFVPAVDGPFFISCPSMSTNPRYRNEKVAEDQVAEIYSYGEKNSIGKVAGLTTVKRGLKRNRGYPTEKKVWLLTKQNKVIQLNEERTQFTVIDIDFESMTRNVSKGYLFIDSVPDPGIKAGETFRYQAKVSSASRSLSYELIYGPPGMTVDNKGLLTWQTSASSLARNRVILKVTDGDKHEERQEFDIAVEGGLSATPFVVSEKPSQSKSPAVTPVKFTGEISETKLLSGFSRAGLGGGGRYLCLLMGGLGKIAIFDVCERKIVGYLPAEDPGTIFAVGHEKVVVAYPAQKKIVRYSLSNQTLELVADFPGGIPIHYITMGASSNGPVLIGRTNASRKPKSTFEFLDLDSLQKMNVSAVDVSLSSESYNRKSVHASANGSAFAIRGHGVMRLQGNQLAGTMADGVPQKLPSADGEYFVGSGVYDLKLNRLDELPKIARVTGLPSVTGGYYLLFETSKWFNAKYVNLEQEPAVYAFGETRMLGRAPMMRNPRNKEIDNDIFFIPEAKVIVRASLYRDSLKYYRFDVDEFLSQSGVEFVNVTSNPQPTVKRGSTFEYQISVKTKSPPRFELDVAPKGMTIDEKGKIIWKTDSESERSNTVIISVWSGEAQTYHKFKLTLN